MLLGSDALSLERILLATPSGSNVRWNDTQLLQLTDRGVKRLVGEILFPETRLVIDTIPGQQEYTLPDMHVVHRVYVNGQAIVPVPGGIETLQGNQTLIYSQGGSSVGANAASLSSGTFQPFGGSLVPAGGSTPGGSGSVGGGGVQDGSAAPPGTTGVANPSWTSQTPVAYPFLNSWGAPAPEAAPWAQGQRPRFYINGNNLGLVPAPSNTAYLTVDGVVVPQTLTAANQQILVPDNFLDGIVSYVMWKAASANAMADRSPAAADNRNAALAELMEEEKKLRTWKRQFTIESNQTLVLTYRGAFRVGGARTGEGAGAW